MKISERLRATFKHIEDPQIPFLYPALLFFSAIALRTFLEFFSDTAQIPFSLFPAHEPIFYEQWVSFAVAIMHFYSYWILVALATGIIFHAVTKEPFEKVLRSVFTCFLVVVITPLVDLLVSGGAGRETDYLYPKSISEFFPIPKGLSAGMASTCTAALIFAFLYCYAKTNSWKKGLGGLLCTYLMLMASALLPLAVGSYHPLPITRVILVVIVAQLLFILYASHGKYFFSLIKDMRWLGLSCFQALFILGIMLTKSTLQQAILQEADAFVLTIVATSLCWAASIMYNKLADCQGDELYRRMAGYSFLLALGCGLGVNFQTFFFVLLMTGNALLYCLPPLRLKRIFIISKCLPALNILATLMLGFIFAGGQILRFPAPLIWYFLIFITLILNFDDIESYEADRQRGVATLPTVLGLRKAKAAIAGVCLLGYCMVSFVFLDLRLLIPMSFLGALQFFIITRKKYSPRWALRVHLAGIIVLILYLAFVRNPF